MQTGNRYRNTLVMLSVMAVVVCAVTWVLYPPRVSTLTHSGILLLTYGLLLLVAWMFPVRLGEQTITITLGIEFPLFLQFGPIVTLLTVNLIWLLSQWLGGRSIRPGRIVSNLSMFTVMVIGAAFAFRLMAGAMPPFLGHMSLIHLVTPGLIYLSVHFFINYTITLWVISRDSRKVDAWAIGVVWDLVALVGEAIIASLLLFSESRFGSVAFLIAAIPFAALIYMFRLYSNLLIANLHLSMISEITMQLTTELNEDELCKILLDGLPRLVIATACYVFILDEEGMLSPIAVRGPSAEIEQLMLKVRLESGQGVTGTAFARGIAQLQRRSNKAVVERTYLGVVPTADPSIIAVPLSFNDVAVGVMTLTHVERNAFSHRDLEMIQILANQVAIGLINARRFAQTTEQSLVDQLTRVYNYRYFETALDKYCRKAEHLGTPLTLLVLDIDHFKQINDAYGHLAGNEVLKSFAHILKEQVREGDIVCRYGGEEFTVILPGEDADAGMQIAERVRKAVETSPVLIPPMGNTMTLPIRITVSVGVATYPLMADSPLNLLRNADRAMYVGSKQRGRNRVALYEQIEG